MDSTTNELTGSISMSGVGESGNQSPSPHLASDLQSLDQPNIIHNTLNIESGTPTTAAIMIDGAPSGESPTAISGPDSVEPASTASSARDVSLSFNPLNPENEFHSFPKLPRELRNQIWGEFLPPPRIYLVDNRYQVNDHLRFGHASKNPRIPVPTVLHINKESRVEAERFYTHVANPRISSDEYSSELAMRVDLARDYVLFTRSFKKLFDREGTLIPSAKWLQGVERLLLHADKWHRCEDRFHVLTTLFPAVKELIFVSGQWGFWWTTSAAKLHLVPNRDEVTGFTYEDFPLTDLRPISQIVEDFAKEKRDFPEKKIPTPQFMEIKENPDYAELW